MIQTNWHTHTSRCGHAVGTDEEYVQAAIQGGLKTLGFSDHEYRWQCTDDGIENNHHDDCRQHHRIK
jgi:Histidinol phosphatase and related hydrolases of the PHP family